MEFTEVLKLRKSVREYKPGQITNEELEKVLWAGSAAPIGKAMYENYRMTVIRNADLIQRISVETGPKMFFKADNPLYSVPTLIIVSGKKGDAASKPLTCANAACIVENMHLMATDIGLASVYFWGFVMAFNQMPELIAAAQIPEGFEAVSALGLGYAEPPQERDIAVDRIATNYVG